MVEKEKEEKKKEYEVVEVTTQTGKAIQTPEGILISDAQLLVKIANDVEEIKKGMLG